MTTHEQKIRRLRIVDRYRYRLESLDENIRRSTIEAARERSEEKWALVDEMRAEYQRLLKECCDRMFFVPRRRRNHQKADDENATLTSA